MPSRRRAMKHNDKRWTLHRALARLVLAAALAGVGLPAAGAQGPSMLEELPPRGAAEPFGDEPPPGPADFEELHTLRVDEGPILVEPTWSGAPVRTDFVGDMIRRRDWFLKADFVILNRGRGDKVPLSVKVERSEGGLSPTQGINPAIPRALTGTSALLRTAPGTRLTLGRHLGVDDRNRDWDLEFTYFGLFDWSGANQLVTTPNPFSDFNFGLLFLTNNDTLPGFNGAVDHRVAYTSDLNNLEMNVRITQRPARDRRVLSPNGVWTRELNSDLYFDLLGGLRFIRQHEQFTFTSRGADADLQRGDYFIETENDLIGLQIGGGAVYERGWWNVGASGKAGGYVNLADQHSVVNFADDRAGTSSSGFFLAPLPENRDERAGSQALAGVGELELFAAAHLRNNIRVRAGWNLMLIQGLALAPEQINFENHGVATISDSGLNVNTGWTLGAEMLW